MRNETRYWTGRLLRAANSIATKAIILVVIFIACPLIVYVELRGADREKSRLLMETVQEQGRLMAVALTPALQRFGAGRTPALQAELASVVSGSTKVKVLFRPETARVRSKGQQNVGFFYVAAWPEVPAAYLDTEWQFLVETGLLDRLRDSCEGERALAVRYTNPAGQWELLSSLTPVRTDAGCWVVLTAVGGADSVGMTIGQPYWKRPEVQVAAAIYLIMAALVLSLFLDVGLNLRGFARLASQIAARGPGHGSFSAHNRVPELQGVAREFDRMVDGLDASAKAIRDAAEENAHAFKTPIAVIAQSVEPIRTSLPPQDERARRALQLVEQATERLDALITAARHMDEAIADLISPPREKVDLSQLLTGMVEAYGETAALQGIELTSEIRPDIFVAASVDLLEIVIENLLDNAFSFSPSGTRVGVTLERSGTEAVLVITDQGPGVDPDNLERIFERYFSDRPQPAAAGDVLDAAHFGMGLWIVRRNVEAVGGRIHAENHPEGGLAVKASLPLYK